MDAAVAAARRDSPVPSVSSLTVRGFKSICRLKQFELGALNVFIGSNGAGKSNLLDVFRMAAAMAAGNLQLFVAQQDGPDAMLFRGRKHTNSVEIDLNFDDHGYSASLTAVGEHLVFLREQTRFATSANKLGSGHYESNLNALEKTEADLTAADLREAMPEWCVYHFHDTSTNSPIRQAQPVRDNLRLHADGANLAPFLRHLRERHPASFRRIVESIRLVAPYFDDFVYRKEVMEDAGAADAEERVELEWFERELDRERPHGPRQLSDGTLRFICLATLLNQPAHFQPNPILLDEPELGLHPYAISLLAEMLQQASATRQILVSTQSADLVGEFAPEEIVTVARRDGRSVFERPNADALRDWLDEYTLGDLWRMNVVGDSPSR